MVDGISQIKKVKVNSVTPHPRNVRQGDVGAITQSLQTHGQYRPIVVQQSTGHIIAGNHTWKAAKALGWKDIQVTFVECSDEEALRILLVDNRTNDLATYDEHALSELLKELMHTDQQLDGTGFAPDELDDLVKTLELVQGEQQPQENMYTQAVNVPQYQIVGEKPELSELADTSRTEALIKQIDEADIPNDVKDFLRLAAQRHIVFNYKKIAEYFPHAPKEIQTLMRESVLVIIDFEDAARLGYVRFDSRMNELEEQDRDDDE